MSGRTGAVVTRDDVIAAAGLVRHRVRRTPVLEVELPGGRPVVLKLELLQHTGSFKPRGAFTTVLSASRRPELLVAASGGNHGLAVAHVGRELGIPARVVVPGTAPDIKVRRLRALGADVVQVGTTYAEALAESAEAAARPGALAIHAYDGPGTVAGQGTVGLELEEDARPDTVLVAVGGGGLMGGVATWFDGRAHVVAVEPRTTNALHEALRAGHPVATTPTGVAADSLGASTIGDIAFEVARRTGVESVLVDDAAIVDARRWLWREVRVAAEPGGAAALAALLSGSYVPGDGERVAVIVCGANADPATLDD
ncbi:MAG TPA: threonine/serine dehydratase [Ornithinibacter sp.]|nr:threonine/serine dehydratase [Ornithinibacter sp.]